MKNKEFYISFLEECNGGSYKYIEGHIYKNFRYEGRKKIQLDDYIIASSHCPQGYRRVYFKGKTLKEHRLIYALHYGVDELFNNECIDHIDGDKANNNISNLRGLTIKQNTIEAEKLGLYKRTYGVINGMCKLSEYQVKSIINEYNKGGVTQRHLAKKYNISQPHVSEIVNKKKRIYM